MSDLAELAAPLERGLADLGLPAALSAPLRSYLALLLRWNQTYNLTAIRDPAEMVTKHLLDSLSMQGFVTTGSLADVGTGPGLPGIPLALAKPDLRVSLIESAGKKARFLREAVRQLGLGERVTVFDARAEAVPESGRHDYLTARAFGTLGQLLAVGGHLLRPGGRALAMKGRAPTEEIADLPNGYRHIATHALTVPGLDAERHLVVIEKD